MERNTICLNNIMQGGTACKNPSITWTNPVCLIVNCIDDNCITVQVPEDCEEKCITFIINCDDCNTCPPIEVTRCLCDEIDGCPDCFVCEDGFCVPRECPDQVCDPLTDTCVDCIDDEGCLCDQVCVNNECGCTDPADFINDKGCCVDCLTDDHCPECHKCIGGTCVEVVCTLGVCNPETRSCVECVEGTDCDVNECCVGNYCVCCEGYYKNDLGVCVEIPNCTTDVDCPDCFVCEAGECVPQVCPDGKVCVDGECVDECDCLNRNCPDNKVCIRHISGVCYCKECEGDCEETVDCGDGCECTDDTCVNAPCYGLCFNGSDCGEGCGCLNNECVSCASLSCVVCETVEGCDCINEVCVDSPCDNPCADGDDCGTGCGCLDNDCVACTAVSCESNPDCPDGCYCNDGTCNTNPCAEVYCESPNDCGQGCGCEEGKCVPCNSLSCEGLECSSVPGCECTGLECGDDNEGCPDELYFTKEECDLRVTLETEACCSCSDIEIRYSTEYTVIPNVLYDQGQYDIDAELWKDGARLDNSPNIADDLPIAGAIEFKMEQTYRRVNNVNGVYVPVAGTTNVTTTSTAQPFSGLAIQNYVFTDANAQPLAAPGAVVTISGLTYVIQSRTISARLSSSLHIANNCRYDQPWKVIASILTFVPAPADPTTYTATHRTTKQARCKFPLFSIIKANTAALLNTNSPTVQFYAPEVSPNTFGQLLKAEAVNLLEYGKYYKLESDCGCVDSTLYGCYENGVTATPLVFCDPVGPLPYEISACGTTLTFTDDVVIACDVYLAAGVAKPSYQLLINGIVVATYTLAASPETILIPDTTQHVITGCINTVELKQVLDTCEECNIESAEACNVPVISDVTITSPCNDPYEGTVTFEVNGGVSPYDYLLTVGATTVASGVGEVGPTITVTDTFPTLSGLLVIEITDASGCVVTETVPYNLSTSNLNSSTILVTSNCTNSIPKITVTNNSSTQVAIEITGANTFNFNLNAGASQTTNVGVGGLWTVTATGVEDITCEYETTTTIDCCTPNPFAATTASYDCTNYLQVQNVPGGAVTWELRDILSNIVRTPPIFGVPLVIGRSYRLTGFLGSCSRVIIEFTASCGIAE